MIRTFAAARSRHTKAVVGVVAVVVLAAGTLALTAGSAFGGGPETVFFEGTSNIMPSTVTVGGQAVDQIEVDNITYLAPARDVVVQVDLSNSAGFFDLKATKTLNGKITNCKYALVDNDNGPEPDPRRIVCPVGDINGPGLDGPNSVSLSAVITTQSAGSVVASLSVFSNTDPVDCSDSCEGDTLHISAASNTEKDTYVPPGGTATVGPTKPDVNNATVGGVTLPKKFDTSIPPSAVAQPAATSVGPGASLSLSVVTAGLNACGGAPCASSILFVSDFPSYNDPKHPALLTLKFFGGLQLDPTKPLYVFRAPNGIGSPAPTCTKVKGAYSNLPCVSKHKFNKKTGEIDDTLAFLSGDPGGARRS